MKRLLALFLVLVAPGCVIKYSKPAPPVEPEERAVYTPVPEGYVKRCFGYTDTYPVLTESGQTQYKAVQMNHCHWESPSSDEKLEE